MFDSVLIANRGEIARRIQRTARRLGMRTIAVYSDADKNARHVQEADEAYRLGPAPATESYLRGDLILNIARESGAACLHPGYGFLAENAEFARACAEAGVTFVGPSPEAMALLGRKDAAKARMADAGVPVIPGFSDPDASEAELLAAAKEIGLPLMIKAVAGGGGKGMRQVFTEQELPAALAAARREAEKAFGDGRLLLEKCLLRPRHIEVQIFADRHGNVLHLFERDCSLQRRHQKVIEEAPAPGLPEALRQKLCQAAVTAAAAAGYEGAGTVEFLVATEESGALSDDTPFYFLEMNTRLQVEHPVTEEVTGLDLVAWQFSVAAGEPLPLSQEAVPLSGHAIEARLYAEDPESGFLPATGRLMALAFPEMPGLRVESGVAAGDEISPYYDPMIAKLIAHGDSRDEALERLKSALSHLQVAGVRTNQAFLHALLDLPAFAQGQVDTDLIAREETTLLAKPDPAPAMAFAALSLLRQRQAALESQRPALSDETWSPWDVTDAFQLAGHNRQIPYEIVIDGELIKISVSWSDDGMVVTLPDGRRFGENELTSGFTFVPNLGAEEGGIVLWQMRQMTVAWPDYGAGEEGGESSDLLRAPMPGRIVRLFVGEGDSVTKGDRVLVLEAMKMEHVLHAPHDGQVARLMVAEGDQCDKAAALVVISPAES